MNARNTTQKMTGIFHQRARALHHAASTNVIVISGMQNSPRTRSCPVERAIAASATACRKPPQNASLRGHFRSRSHRKISADVSDAHSRICALIHCAM